MITASFGQIKCCLDRNFYLMILYVEHDSVLTNPQGRDGDLLGREPGVWPDRGLSHLQQPAALPQQGFHRLGSGGDWLRQPGLVILTGGSSIFKLQSAL